jgi:hypothetical protein
MEFIDKSMNQAEGNLLVNTFLTSRWNNLNNNYTEINYSTNPNHPFRQLLRIPLRDLLLNEQHNRCCYCMRSIDENSTTFEHIVPKSIITIQEWKKYSHFNIIRDNVCLQSVFDSANVIQNTPPYPLEIAYENLAASCNGRIIDGISKDNTAKFCNNKRGNKFVEPLFYLVNVSTEIEYKPAGLLVPRDVTYASSIQNVHLNYDTLEKIRQVWYHLSVEEIENIINAVTETDRNIILTLNLMSLLPRRRNQLIRDFKTETFWKILIQYKWFYTYYRNNYPISARFI